MTLFEMNLVIRALVLLCLCWFATPDAQGEALYALKTSLNASNDQLKDWNLNLGNHPCTWSKVICDSNSNVTIVTLSNMGFTGTLSPRIGILNKLTILQLQGNSISGSIPDEFGNLESLTMLDLKDNNLTGEIPDSLGNLKKLTFLILSQNNLFGSIPESLAHLPNLVNLQLASNNLSGNIPH